MNGQSFGSQTAETAQPRRLDSWKAIAAYFRRDVTTVQRWERREGMPVHRHVHDKRGSVYAIAAELDAWRLSRKSLEGELVLETPDAEDAEPSGQARARLFAWFRATGQAAKWPAMIGGIVLAAAAVLLYAQHRGNALSAPHARIGSLAVLPLANLSGDPAQEYLADGMTEALIGRLSRIRDLRVISYTSVQRFRNARLSVQEIASALGIEAIVEGSVTRIGAHLRVTAQLIRARNDDHLWAETYDRELGDVLSLESELAQAIARQVEATVTGEERTRLSASRAVSPAVYENYLQGEFAYKRANNKNDLERSLVYYRKAIELDPTFAPAYVGSAHSYEGLGTIAVAGLPPAQARAKVENAARKALELDPNLAEAHLILGRLAQVEWRWHDAEREFRKAIEVDPNNAHAVAMLGTWLTCQGRIEEALDLRQRVRELDPDPVAGQDVGFLMLAAHRFDEAASRLRDKLAREPDDFQTLLGLGIVLSASEHPAEAIRFLERPPMAGSPGAIGVLIMAYARSGQRAKALELLDDLERRAATGYVPSGAFLNAYLGLGDTEKAFRSLEQAYGEQATILQFAKVHPFFDAIRDDPRFADLVRRIFN